MIRSWRNCIIYTICLTAWLGTAAAGASREVFLDLFLGRSFPAGTDIRVRQPARQTDFVVRRVSLEDRSFEGPLWYNLRVGTFLKRPDWVGLALDFKHAKIYARTSESKRATGFIDGERIDGAMPVDSLIQRFDVSHGINYLFLDLIARRRIARHSLRAGIGAGVVIAHPENRIRGEANDQKYEIAGAALQVSLGMRTPLSKRLSAAAEYALTISDPDIGVAGGSARMHDRTSHVSLGVAIRSLPD